MFKKQNKIITLILLLFVTNVVLFLVAQDVVYATGCKPGRWCSEWYYCYYDAESECDAICAEHQGCNRVYLENATCDEYCYCWSEWTLICNDYYQDDHLCWEYDLWDCWGEQK